jgi:predicted metal-binding transcription factor (methanogenesis marker protein 9)
MTNTTRPMVRIHDLATDEVIDREMNDAEFVEYKAREAEKVVEQAEAEAKAATRQALLTRLGLSAEEAQLLLGGN